MRITKNLCLTFMMLCGNFACAADPLLDAQERLDQFFLRAYETSEQYAVTGLITSTEKTANETGDVTYSETVFRKIIGKQGTRFEMATSDPLGQRSTNIFEHNLALLPNRFLHVFDVKIGGKINTIDDNKFKRMDPLGKFDPMAAVLQIGSFYVPISNLEKDWSGGGFKFFAAERLRDNGLRARALHANGSGIAELTFAGEPEWVITRMKEFLNPRDPIDPNRFRPIDTRDWYENSDTIAKWKQVEGGDIWVPFLVTAWQKASDYSLEHESQLQLLDWRFGKDVPLRLLDESTFTTETLRQEINFDDLRRLFEQQPKSRTP